MSPTDLPITHYLSPASEAKEMKDFYCFHFTKHFYKLATANDGQRPPNPALTMGGGMGKVWEERKKVDMQGDRGWNRNRRTTEKPQGLTQKSTKGVTQGGGHGRGQMEQMAETKG